MSPRTVPDDTLYSRRVKCPASRLNFVLSNLKQCDFTRGVASGKKGTVGGVRDRGDNRPGDYLLGLGNRGAGNGVDSDGAVRGAYGDLVDGGGRNRGRGEFQRQCGGGFKGFVIDRYRAFCDDDRGATGTQFGYAFGLAVGGGWGTTIQTLALHVAN